MESAQILTPAWASAHFAAFDRSLNGGARSALHARRREAFDVFSKSGLPTPQIEEWKYTDMSALAKLPLRRAEKGGAMSEGELARRFGAALPGRRAVFINGWYSAALSRLPQECAVHPLGELVFKSPADCTAPADCTELKLVEQHLGRLTALEDQPFAALNTSFLSEGALVMIGRGVRLAEPIALLFVTGGAGQADVVTYPRVLVVAEENSQSSVVEYYLGCGAEHYFTDAVSEIVLAPGAVLHHHKVVRENSAAFHVGAVNARLARDAVFASHTFSFGGQVVRNEVRSVLAGSGNRATLNGLSVLNADQHVDNHTVLDHAAPHSESRELFKGIYAEKSLGVFSGTIIVRPDAQKTNAYQSSQSLLLSREAAVDTRPQLKIWADDVKCTHGASVGQIDEDALFYIRSRGVGEREARNMLMHAFASTVISQVKSAALREYLEAALMEKLKECQVGEGLASCGG